MYFKKIIKLISYTTFLLGMFLLMTASVNAQVVAESGSTFGAWQKDNASGSYYATEDFKLLFSDKENGLNKLELTPSASSKIPINHNMVFSGLNINLDFEYYDVNYDETYVIKITDGIGVSDLSYGNDYKSNITKDYDDAFTFSRFLPSTLEFKEYDLMSNNETIGLNLKFVNYDKTNQLKSNPSMEVKKNNHNLTWKQKTIEESIFIDLYIALPLKLANNDLFKAGGVLSDSATHSGEKILQETIAHIQLTPEGASFDPWYKHNTNQKPIVNNEETKDFEYVETEKFSGHGLNQIQEGTFKGISQEKNFADFIIGITNFILSFVAVIAILMLVFGGYMWIVDTGDEQMVEKGKKTIMGAVAGLLLIISAYTIVNTVVSLEGTSDCDIKINLMGAGSSMNCQYEGTQAITAGVGSVLGGVVGGDLGTMAGATLGLLGEDTSIGGLFSSDGPVGAMFGDDGAIGSLFNNLF